MIDNKKVKMYKKGGLGGWVWKKMDFGKKVFWLKSLKRIATYRITRRCLRCTMKEKNKNKMLITSNEYVL